MTPGLLYTLTHPSHTWPSIYTHAPIWSHTWPSIYTHAPISYLTFYIHSRTHLIPGLLYTLTHPSDLIPGLLYTLTHPSHTWPSIYTHAPISYLAFYIHSRTHLISYLAFYIHSRTHLIPDLLYTLTLTYTHSHITHRVCRVKDLKTIIVFKIWIRIQNTIVVQPDLVNLCFFNPYTSQSEHTSWEPFLPFSIQY